MEIVYRDDRDGLYSVRTLLRPLTLLRPPPSFSSSRYPLILFFWYQMYLPLYCTHELFGNSPMRFASCKNPTVSAGCKILAGCTFARFLEAPLARLTCCEYLLVLKRTHLRILHDLLIEKRRGAEHNQMFSQKTSH